MKSINQPESRAPSPSRTGNHRLRRPTADSAATQPTANTYTDPAGASSAKPRLTRESIDATIAAARLSGAWVDVYRMAGYPAAEARRMCAMARASGIEQARRAP